VAPVGNTKDTGHSVHAITQHIGVNPRVMETTGRVLFGLEPDTPLL